MAIDTIPPWVRGPNVEAALASGGAVGEGAARIQVGREESAARLAQDAVQHNQQLQMESARLSQSEHLAQMEAQARKEVNEQNQLREQQRLAITSAYHQAQLGIEKGRLEQQQAVAEAKAKNAAEMFQQEQGFAQYIKEHPGDVIGAMQQFPRVGNTFLNSISKASEGNKPIHVGDAIVERQPDGTFKEKYRSPHANKPIKVGKNLVQLNEDGTVTLLYGPGEERKDDILGAASEPAAQSPGLMSRIKNAFSPSALPAKSTTSSKDKVVRAHALGIAHPDWTKEQIIEAVEKESK